ncbi:MAG: hypothetical protein Q7K65_03460 [Candidatus Buchananbacteria bacterium]|nr:hypothetical protein [Candidatus Buchananbacteria bacterium]
MINPVRLTAISESYRLSHNGMHQGRVAALQAEFDGLMIKAPGVSLEISREALKIAEKNKNIIEQKRVKPVVSVSLSHNHHSFRR